MVATRVRESLAAATNGSLDELADGYEMAKDLIVRIGRARRELQTGYLGGILQIFAPGLSQTASNDTGFFVSRSRGNPLLRAMQSVQRQISIDIIWSLNVTESS
jgi:hypothetical protein